MQNIFSIINGKKVQLPKKEQLLGEYIIANPESVISSSIQKLSKDTGISTATIVRFCREIGTNGFGDLKLQLVAARSNASNNDYHEFDAGEGIAAIKNTMAARFKSVIEATQVGLNDQSVEKAIQKSDIGINPTDDGKVIRLVFPQLTEERRKELVKQVKKMSEDCKVVLRNERRDILDKAKKMKKDMNFSEDELASFEKDVQKSLDKYIENAEELYKAKEKEILEI